MTVSRKPTQLSAGRILCRAAGTLPLFLLLAGCTTLPSPWSAEKPAAVKRTDAEATTADLADNGSSAAYGSAAVGSNRSRSLFPDRGDITLVAHAEESAGVDGTPVKEARPVQDASPVPGASSIKEAAALTDADSAQDAKPPRDAKPAKDASPVPKADSYEPTVPDKSEPPAPLQPPVPVIAAPSMPVNCDVPRMTPAPLTLENDVPSDYWDLSLNDALQVGLSQATVLRDLGGALLQAPSQVRTIHAPAIRYTDPRFGVEQALSQFDARFTTSSTFQNNDRALNNVFLGGGTRLFNQDLNVYQTELSKRSATGGIYALRNRTEYDANNSPGNLFGSAFTTFMEGEARQPLLQGAGLEFNRIAGFDPVPFVFTGVSIARIDSDVELADFEAGVRDYVSNVENAYWDLYFAYRDLDTKILARDRALETWQQVKALLVTNARGGDPATEARAREQYFRYEEEVRDALNGRPGDGTRTNNGSGGGTFRGTGGVLLAERRLRLLIGLPVTDGRLIRPCTNPISAEVLFDWDTSLAEALHNRPELEQQHLRIRRRELELTANKNYLKPRLDAVALYRFRGFGKDLIDASGSVSQFDNAVGNLTGGNFQEWQLGMELDVPIGFRRAHSAVRNAELQVARERAILREQERQIVFELSNAFGEVKRAYEIVSISLNRYQAAKTQLATTEQDFARNRATADELLDAQRRLADAQTRYFLAVMEYAVAIRNVHYEKGSLLQYNGIALTSGPGDTVTVNARH